MALHDTEQTPAPRTPTIATEINSATRTLHTQLNRLIVERLPLALPPHASDPSLYLVGLASFAEIYFTFERSWRDILAHQHPVPLSSPSPQHQQQQQDHADDILSFLATLLPASLPRTSRLQNDLSIGGRPKRPRKAHRRERSFMEHIARATHARPHVLVAYAWVMYMAIFSGGRYIRLQLAAAGEEFWTHRRRRRDDVDDDDDDDGQEKTEEKEEEKEGFTTTTTPPVYPGFTFLHFDQDTHDGEDVKNAFKARLAAAETLLTPAERADVVAEARRIFEGTIELVLELDDTVGQRHMMALPRRDDEKASLLLLSRPPVAVEGVHARFAARRVAARRLAGALAALLLLYLLAVCVL